MAREVAGDGSDAASELAGVRRSEKRNMASVAGKMARHVARTNDSATIDDGPFSKRRFVAGNTTYLN